jgi:hypothetical protein
MNDEGHSVTERQALCNATLVGGGDSWGMPSAAGSPPRTNAALPVRAALTRSSRDGRIKRTIGDSENTEILAFTSGGGWCRGVPAEAIGDQAGGAAATRVFISGRACRRYPCVARPRRSAVRGGC